MAKKLIGSTSEGFEIWEGTSADRIAFTDAKPRTIFIEGLYAYRLENGTWNPISTGGAAHVQTDLAQGIVMGKRIKAFHPREKDALAGTAVTFDWSATPVSAVILKPSQEAAGTAELLASIAYVVDPPNDAFRDAALAASTNLAGDTLRYTLRANEDELITFDGDTIDYLGVIRDVGSENLRLVAVGIEVYP